MFKLKGIVVEDSGKSVYKPEGSDKQYPWRQIKIKREGFNNPYAVGVLPDFYEGTSVGKEVEIDVELVPTQKGLASGAVMVNLKLQSVDLFNSKIQK